MAADSVSSNSKKDVIFDSKLVFDICNSKFFLPNYEQDLIQNSILDLDTYFEIDHLEKLDEYLPKDAVILDVGANIGNHTLYWANESHAKRIYSFEPVPYTFKILEKNIEINNLQDTVKLFNIGLSEEKGLGVIQSFDTGNIGGTNITETKEMTKETIPLETLDSINIDDDKIDLIKIDVEGMDYKVLSGAIKTIRKYKPMIMLESFPPEFVTTSRILKALGYKKDFDFDLCEYLYVYDL